MTSLNQSGQLIPYNKDGLEIVINTQTGEAFASIRATARMANRDESVIRRWAGAAKLDLKMAQIQTGSGLQGAALLNEDQIFAALKRYNPERLEDFAKVGIRVYLHTLAGYQVRSNAIVEDHPLEKARTIYLNRMEELEKTLWVPEGYWTVIQECGMLMLKIERMGYPIDAYDIRKCRQYRHVCIKS